MSEFLKRIADFSPKRLLLLAAELEERVRTLEGRNHAPIAIIGIGCRYPGGVRDAETYWKLVSEGIDAITQVPSSRWDVNALYDPDPHAEGRVASRWGGFLDAPELFDPGFFGIAPKEAEAMDPQQRLLLEVSWEALEDAAITPSTLAGSRTGVYVGLCNSDYAEIGLLNGRHQLDAYFAQGASHAVAAGRISYFLGLRGPSLAIDTACSSSLVAVHQACQSLRFGETDLALAGGVNLLFSPEVTMALSRAQMMASDGRCKAFSAEADGFVRSEGCGLVVLKRLDDALRDGDRVVAVIRGSAANQDGRSSGITAPNGPSQEDVIHAALADAGLSPHSVGYVEAHGSGTKLGDPIELRALHAALGKGRSEAARLVVGSVKSNFGHAESAAGIAGLIKLALSLQHGQIPPSLHFVRPNPEVDWENNRLRIPTATEPWQPAGGETVRIGAVSSFGFSGTNAHLVVSEAPSESAGATGEDDLCRSYVIPLSARSEKALRVMAAQLADSLRENATLRLENVAYTLATGRSSFQHRAALRTKSKAHLVEELTALAADESQPESEFARGVVENRKPRVAFLFAGLGGERTGMGFSLLQHSEVFRDAIAEVDDALTGVIPAPITVIFRNEHQQLAQSALVQPALFAFQYGLARVWQSWGIEPHIVVGHSMGEIVACALAGVLSVQDASLLVAARGKTIGDLGDPGGMVAVAASEEQALAGLARFSAEVSIAAINGPTSVVISGRSEPLEQATQGFERAGFRVKRLNICYGSHSPAMHRVLPAFHQEASKLRYQAPRMPILADLTGEMVEDANTFNAQYFTGHLSRPVQFQRCLDRLEREGCGLCIEMGPRAVLTTFGRERTGSTARFVASANGREEDFEALQAAVAEVFTAGAPLDWKAIYRNGSGRKIALPRYPFERERYWISDEDSANTDSNPPLRESPRLRSSRPLGLAGSRVDASVPLFETEWTEPLPLHLAEHRVGEQVVLPASAYLSLAWNAFQSLDKLPGPAKISDVTFACPLELGDGPIRVQTAVTKFSASEEAFAFRISSRRGDDGQWTLHATGRLESVAEPTPHANLSFDRTSAPYLSGEEFYRMLDERGVHLGGPFRAIQELWYGPGAALGHVVANSAFDQASDVSVGPHPALLDACFQVLGAAALFQGDSQLRLMTAMEEIQIHGELCCEMFVEAHLETQPDGAYTGNLRVRTPNGSLLASANGIVFRPFASDSSIALVGEGWLYEQTWQPAPLRSGSVPGGEVRQWIILGSASGHAGAVAERLTSLGHKAGVASGVDTLTLFDAPGSHSEIVDLLAIDADFDEIYESAEAVGERAVALIAGSVNVWRHLLQTKNKLWLFTKGAQPVRNVSRLAGSLQATVWGLARCATLEDPQRLQRIIDLDPAANFDDTTSIIVQELLSRDEEEQIAYAGNLRMGFRLKPSEQRTARAIESAKTFRSDSSYLLTGGVGGLGLQVAAWLGKQGAGKLVLTTRSRSSVDARQEEISAIKALGVDLTIVQADVADAAAMRQLFARFAEHGDLPPLHGIFHMAADVNGSPIGAITEAQIRSMSRAKIVGTWNLYELSQSLPLDFFVAFSSTAAVLGASNLGHYAAANSFVDAMVSLDGARKLSFTAINWGTWQTMRLASREVQQQYSSGGMLPMPDDAALGWLGSLLGMGEVQRNTSPRPMVAHVDWERLAPLYEAKRKRHWLEFVRGSSSVLGPAAKPSWIAEPGESRLNSLERAVQKEAARVLGFRRGELPGTNTRLAELGLDSLMAVNLRNRLQALIGHALSSTFAFEYPTPAEMALALDLLLWGSGVVDEAAPTNQRDEIQI